MKENCSSCGKYILRYLTGDTLQKFTEELNKYENEASFCCTAFCYQKLFGMRDDPFEDPLLRQRIDNGTAMKPILVSGKVGR